MVSVVSKGVLDALAYAGVKRLITAAVHVIPVIDIILIVSGGDMSQLTCCMARTFVVKGPCKRILETQAEPQSSNTVERGSGRILRKKHAAMKSSLFLAGSSWS